MGVGGIDAGHVGASVPESNDSAQVDAGAPAAEATAVRGGGGTVPLTPARQAKILADAVKLGDAGIRKHPIAGGLPLGIEFASIDASKELGAFGSVSFGHKVTLLVPQGPLVPNPKIKHDPNHAKEFYVQMGASTNTPAGVYGPFKIK